MRAASGGVAQSVEQWTENPRVPSSILGPATTRLQAYQANSKEKKPATSGLLLIGPLCNSSIIVSMGDCCELTRMLTHRGRRVSVFCQPGILSSRLSLQDSEEPWNSAKTSAIRTIRVRKHLHGSSSTDTRVRGSRTFEGNAQLSHPASEGIRIDAKELCRASGAADFTPGLSKCLADVPGCRLIEREDVFRRHRL